MTSTIYNAVTHVFSNIIVSKSVSTYHGHIYFGHSQLIVSRAYLM